MNKNEGVLKKEVLDALLEVNAKLNNKESFTQKYAEAVESTVELFGEDIESEVEDILDFYFQVMFAVDNGDLLVDRTKKRDEKFEFGFKELRTLFSVLGVVTEGNEGDTESNVKTQLKVSDLRGGSLYDLNTIDFIDDLTLVRASMGLSMDLTVVSPDVMEALEKKEDESTEKVKKLEEVEDLRALVKASVGDILALYDKTIALGYQLDPFKAMLVEDTEARPEAPATLVLKNRELAYMSSLKAAFVAKAVRTAIPDVDISFNRQVDLNKIYESQQTVYYPLKIAEFALGSPISYDSQDLMYGRISARTWSSKSGNGYSHRGAIEKYLTKTLWKYLVVVVECNNLWEEIGKGYVGIETSKLITSYIRRYINTFSTFAILKDYTGTSTDWASVDIILSAPSGSIVKNPMQELVVEVFNNNGKLETPKGASYKGIDYKFFKHVADPRIAEAMPLFAYKALETLKATGQEIDIKNFVVGRDLNGGIVASSVSRDAVMNLGLNLIHCINSGSRQGKGVMTTTAVATSVAGGRMVFGSDRKPDTMVQFYEASGGADDRGTPKGYYVNGGAFNSSFMSPKYAKELDWDKNPLIRTRWSTTTPSWWNISSYSGFLGDMVYYRHILLTLGLVCLRVAVKADQPDLYEKLGGDNGIFVIYDEMTNWQNSFMLQYINPRGANSLFGDDIFYTFEKEQELKSAKLELKNDNIKEVARMKFEDVVKRANTDTFKKGVYARDLFYNLNTSLLYLEEQSNAGLKGGESMFSDIYMIGQALEVVGLKEGQTQLTLNKSGSVNRTQFESNSDPLSWFLMNFNTDYILGPNDSNGNTKKYAWRQVDKSDGAKYLVDGLGRFGYFADVSVEALKKGSPSDYILGKAVEKYTDGGAVYFKPYLILNSADPSSNAIQTLERRLGDNLAAVKAMNSDENGNWHEGIGFDGYVKMMSGGATDTATSFIKAREVADMVVRKMGYEGDYLDFLMDLRPEWNFSVKDVVMAFTQEEEYQKGNRFATWKSYEDLMNGSSQDEEVVEEELEEIEDDSLGALAGLRSESSVDNVVDSPKVDLGVVDKPKLEEVKNHNADLGSNNNLGSNGFASVDQSTSDAANEQFDYMQNVETVVGDTLGRTVPYEDINEDFMFTDGVGRNLKENPRVASAIEELASALGLSKDIVRTSVFGSNRSNLGGVGDFNSFATESGVNESQYTFGDNTGSEQGVIYGLRDLQVFMTNTVLDAFGDSYNIESIEVRGGALIVNNIKYVQSFPNLRIDGLPIDKQIQMQNKQYAEVFDFSCLQYLDNLTYLTIDSPQFMLTRVIRGLGLREDSNVFALFSVLPRLRELTLAGQTFTREDANVNPQRSETVFNSAKRRQRVIDRAEETGRNYRRARWDSTKRYWSSNRGARRWLGAGVHMTGAVGATAVEGGAKASRLASGIFKSAKRLFSDIGKDIKGSGK